MLWEAGRVHSFKRHSGHIVLRLNKGGFEPMIYTIKFCFCSGTGFAARGEKKKRGGQSENESATSSGVRCWTARLIKHSVA